jgi:hypothetical protein
MQRTIVRPLERVDGLTRCSFAENLIFPTMKLSMLFFYRERLDTTRLKEALAHVLSDYSLYAGKLSRRKGTFCIEHGVAGAAFELTESAELIDELGSGPSVKLRSTQLFPQLSVWRILSGLDPVFGARITQAADGTVLGIDCHHMVGDLASSMTFLRAWALAYAGRPYEKPLQVLDRDAYLDTHVPQPVKPARASELISWRQFMTRLAYHTTHRASVVELQFPWHEVSRIHAAAGGSQSVTRNDAVCAYLLGMTRQLASSEAASQLALVINYRKRYGMPSSLIGNMTDLVRTSADAGAGIAGIASNLRQRIDGFTAGPLSHHEFTGRKAELGSVFQRMRLVAGLSQITGSLYVTTLTNSGVYDLSFETSHPAYFAIGERAQLPWVAMVMESPQDAGLTICLWLPQKSARQLMCTLEGSSVGRYLHATP